MKSLHLFLAAARDWLQQAVRESDHAQSEGALESLRRFIVTLWFFVPLETALALWFGLKEVPAAAPESWNWAMSLFVVHTLTAIITLILAIAVRRLLQSPQLPRRRAVAIQIALCAVYLTYGAAISIIDLSIGAGISSYLLVTVAIGGFSLMRPIISVAMYSASIMLFWHLLSFADPSPTILLSMRINALAATILAIALSIITWRLYARGILLRSDLEANNQALHDTQQELELLAWNDPLTGLPNRRFLLERLREALVRSSRTGSEGALLLIDLDNFKLLNDTRGHHAGDLLLQSVAKRITGVLRESDTVARLGGDEFVVMLENLEQGGHNDGPEQAKLVGQKILETLGQPHQLVGFEHRTTPSIGIAMFSEHQQTADELLKRADMAMYQAKGTGRNAVRFYAHDIQARVDAKVALELALREGMVKGELRLVFQALNDSHGCVVGAEALVRWQNQERGMVSPAEFIPLAEETGLIIPLGNWVLDTACRQLASWTSDPLTSRLTLAVNVSVRQFRETDFVDSVLERLRLSGAPAGQLKLELTESLMAADVDGIVRKMDALHAHGVQFSLDDFGTGYSSLSYLRRLPFDVLKIDQSFVRDILSDASAKAIATTIVALAKNLEIELVAEGVETAEQRDFLLNAGCQLFQGYFFSRPVPIEQFESALKSGTSRAS